MHDPLTHLTPDDVIRAGAGAECVVKWLEAHAPDVCVLPVDVAARHDVGGRIARAAGLDGYGDGNGYGYGKGNGYGNGDGDGYVNGYGNGNGYGYGKGYGYGNGSGDGYGYVDAFGDGYGDGDGDNYGDGWSHAPRSGE